MAENRTSEKQNVLLIIPAYNEAESIESVVNELLEHYPQLDYLVVTDGSTDGTPDICEKNGYHYLRLPVNLGLSGCFQAGMKYAFRCGYSYAVQFDGDGQHRPEYILPMLRKMQEENCDIVLGSRFLPEESVSAAGDTGQERESLSAAETRVSGDGDSASETERSAEAAGSRAENKETLPNEMSTMRSLGSRLIRAAIRLTTGVTVTDPTCGLRMYNRRMIDLFANRLNHAPEPDTISFLIKNGAKTAETFVRVQSRESGQSYLRPLNAAFYMLRMLTSILLVQNFRI